MANLQRSVRRRVFTNMSPAGEQPAGQSDTVSGLYGVFSG